MVFGVVVYRLDAKEAVCVKCESSKGKWSKLHAEVSSHRIGGERRYTSSGTMLVNERRVAMREVKCSPDPGGPFPLGKRYCG
jgi:hypothetical protein